jgi:hypothetical protein
MKDFYLSVLIISEKNEKNILFALVRSVKSSCLKYILVLAFPLFSV